MTTRTLPELLSTLWGRKALQVGQDYEELWSQHPEVLADLAVFCNVTAPIAGATEFDRGVEEGKRRVWLHIARVARLRAEDFMAISHGEKIR